MKEPMTAQTARDLAKAILRADAPEHLRLVSEACEAALCDAAQFIDTVRQDAIREDWWTEWDQEMRNKISVALALVETAKAGAEGAGRFHAISAL